MQQQDRGRFFSAGFFSLQSMLSLFRHRSVDSLRLQTATLIALSSLFVVHNAHAATPVAAYSFDAGAGSQVADVSGAGIEMTLRNGATWSAGRFGKAASFDGINDFAVANFASPSLNLAGGRFTISAWINPRSNAGWQMIVNKPHGSSHSSPYFDWSLHREMGTGKIVAFLGCDRQQRASSSATPLNAWTHVAVTYDGTSLRHYINGVLDRTTALSCSVTNTNSMAIRIGANAGSGEVMNGLIDDVRIYDATLSAAQILTDMSTPLEAPSVPDSSPTVVSIASPTSGSTVSGAVTISANASSGFGIAGVQFRVNGQNVGGEDRTVPYSTSWETTLAPNGSYEISAVARDVSGNLTNSIATAVTVNNSAAPPPSPPPSSGGAIAAYSFDGQSGTAVQDVSGQGNSLALVNGPLWSAGRFGTALSFDGVNDSATANAYNAALNLTGRSLTLSAWVNPRSNSTWQMIVNKPFTTGHREPYFEWSMHREAATGRLAAYLGCDRRQLLSNAPVPANAWTHVAVTYDGTSLRHYINGALDRSTSISCAVSNTNSAPIRIGSNGGGGEVLNGLIDDVRIYNRPLTAAQIQADMATALPSAGSDPSPPPPPPPPPPSGSQFGLDFPGSAATTGTIRFRFTNPLAIYPATYVWRIYPRSQAEYYTTFFWGNDGEFWWDNGRANTTYGAHPYPNPSPNNVSRPQDVGPRYWEIAVDALDVLSPTQVQYNRWHTQALRVWSDANGKHHEFYWDLPDTTKVIRHTTAPSYGNKNPPKPALTWGDAPWAPSKEIMYGIIRGIQIYSSTLSFQDVLNEVSRPLSTPAGASSIWYMNLNPTPTDISDKSGAGHHPEWVGSERPTLWRSE